MKTPDEIKKGLDCCNQFRSGGHWNICSECPCDIGKGRCDGTLETDAMTYIVQLEAERDAAVADIRLAFTSYVGACQTCKHGENQVDCIEPIRCPDCENEKCKCQSCDGDFRNWEWRGVQKEG